MMDYSHIRITQAHADFLKQAQSLCGSLWKEVYSEVHDQFKEIPVWILFYEDTSLPQAHETFKDLVVSFIPKIGEFQFTVAYECYSAGNIITYDFLTNNEEILRGWSVNPPLGSQPSSNREKSQLFQSQDSKRT